MAKRLGLAMLGLGLTLGACSKAPEATTRAPTATPAKVEMTAYAKTVAVHRLYQLGEAHFDRGVYTQAVALWRQVFLLLPPGEEGDQLRHELVARMGYALMMDYRRGGDAAQLDWGREMLERYAAKHEALFGNDEAAVSARGEIYDLIGEMELMLEEGQQLEVDPSDVASRHHIDAEFDELAQQQVPNDHAGESVGGEMRREITVKSNRFATTDDPKVQRYLRGGGFLGPSILMGGDEPYNATRPLVRAGAPRIESDPGQPDQRRARRRAWEVLRSARPELEQCYLEAVTRKPVLSSKLQVAMTFDTEGRVTSSDITEGSLIDAVGNACVLWAMMRTAAPAEELALASNVDVRLPLTFFIEMGKSARPSMVPGGWGMGDAIQGFEAGLVSSSDQGVDVGYTGP